MQNLLDLISPSTIRFGLTVSLIIFNASVILTTFEFKDEPKFE